jgi:hypothetical protein
MSTITTTQKCLFIVNAAKTAEAKRIKRRLNHEKFLIYLVEVYNRVSGDTAVLDRAWEKVREEMGGK